MVKALNRAKAATSTTGTGTITIGAAETGYTDFRKAYTDYDYRIVIEDGSDWEISSSTITHGSWVEGYNVSEADGQIYSLAFKPDGTKMYVGHGGTTDGIYQYSLSTAWDVTTASYDSKSLAIYIPYSILFNSDGTKLFVMSNDGDVDEYTLSTAYDVSTAGTATNHNFSLTGTRGMTFNGDGTKIHTVKDEGSYAGVYEYSLSTAYDITSISGGSPYAHSQTFSTEGLTSVGISSAYDIKWNSDGTRLFILHNSVSSSSGNNISQWKCTTAYDITTAYFDGYALYNLDYFAVASTRTQIDYVAKAYSIAVKSDTEIFAGGWISDLSTECTVAKYTVGTSTATRSLIESSTGSLLNLSGSAKVFNSLEADDIATWQDQAFSTLKVYNSSNDSGIASIGTEGGGNGGLVLQGLGDNFNGIFAVPTSYPWIRGQDGHLTFNTAGDFFNTNYNITFTATGYIRFTGADSVDIYPQYLKMNHANGAILWEGTGDANETSLGVVDPTADRTINLPDASGTVAVYSADGTNGQVLTTDGAGTLSFADAGGGGGGDMSWQSAWPDDPQTTTSNGNYAIGLNAGASLTSTTQNNILIGYNAGTLLASSSGQNLAIGNDALDVATSASNNVAIAQSALGSLTTGSANIAIGNSAHWTNTTGNQNTSVGHSAGGGTTGSYNTYLGALAGNYNSSGKDYQVAVGYNALNDCSSDNTVGIGYNAVSDGSHAGSVGVGAYALNRSSTSSANYNTALGYSAGGNQYSGDYNVYIGYDAEPYYNNSSYGVAIGYQARHNHNGCTSVGAFAGTSMYQQSDYHTLIGQYAGYDMDGGDYATFVGYQCGYSGGTGSYNTGVGAQSLYYLTSGGNNTAVGRRALYNCNAGSNNTAIGRNAGDYIYTGNYNTTLGYECDVINTGTVATVAVGYNSRVDNNGVSIGYQAGYSASSGSNANVLVGYEAGYDLDGGDFNTFLGYRSGYNGGSDSYNTGVGYQTLYSLTSGTNNACIGAQSLFNVTSSDYNTGLGSQAGYNVTTGANNTLIGRNAGYRQGTDTTNQLTTGSNVTVVGFEAMPSSGTATNEITLGDNNITSLRCNVQTISSLSDERDKTAIEDLPYGLDFINDMRPVQFTWNRRDGSLGATPDMGFIAQDLYDVELDHSSTSRTRLVNWENPEKLEADYLRSYPILVKAVQQLSAKCDALEARIAELEGT